MLRYVQHDGKPPAILLRQKLFKAYPFDKSKNPKLPPRDMLPIEKVDFFIKFELIKIDQ